MRCIIRETNNMCGYVYTHDAGHLRIDATHRQHTLSKQCALLFNSRGHHASSQSRNGGLRPIIIVRFLLCTQFVGFPSFRSSCTAAVPHMPFSKADSPDSAASQKLLTAAVRKLSRDMCIRADSMSTDSV